MTHFITCKSRFVQITDLILQRKLPNHIIGEFLFADALHDETAPGLRLSFLRPVAATLFLYIFVYYILAYTSFDITREHFAELVPY